MGSFCLLCLFIPLALFAEPFLAPNDPFLRHEIRLLGDKGGINSLYNTWPFDLRLYHQASLQILF